MTNSKISISFTERQLDIIMLILTATEKTEGIGKFGITKQELEDLFLYINSKRKKNHLEAYR